MLVAGHEDSNGCINYEGEGQMGGSSHMGQVKYSLGLSLSLDLGSKKCQARGRALPSPGAGGQGRMTGKEGAMWCEGWGRNGK